MLENGDHPKGIRYHNNSCLQPRSAEEHPRTDHTSNLEAAVLLNTPLADFIAQNALGVVVKKGKGERPKSEKSGETRNLREINVNKPRQTASETS